MKLKSTLSSLIRPITATLIFSCCFLSSAFARPDFPAGGGLWNTNLRMINILELENPSETRQQYTIEAYDNTGNKFAERSYSLAGHTQRDIILNDSFLQGRENQFGIIVITAADYDLVVARISYYRWNPEGTEVEFAFSVPADGLSIIRVGTTAVQFNSYQPSYNPADADAKVDQWLSIVNLSETSERFTINTYNEAGEQIDTKTVRINSHERRDISAGDTRESINIVDNQRAMLGLHKIIPATEGTYYAAQLIRYGRKAGVSEEYAFAVPVQSTIEFMPFAFTPISRGAGADNYVELSNPSNVDSQFQMMIFGYDSKIKVRKEMALKAHQQVHINVGSYLEEGEAGVFVASEAEKTSVQHSESPGLAVTGVSYFYNADGSILSTSTTPWTFPVGTQSVTSYNLYLDSENWLRLLNVSNEESTITIKIADSLGELTEKQFTVPPLNGIEIPLHEFVEYNTAADTFGEIIILGEVIGEMIRLGGATTGDIDFTMSTPVGYVGMLIN